VDTKGANCSNKLETELKEPKLNPNYGKRWSNAGRALFVH